MTLTPRERRWLERCLFDDRVPVASLATVLVRPTRRVLRGAYRMSRLPISLVHSVCTGPPALAKTIQLHPPVISKEVLCDDAFPR